MTCEMSLFPLSIVLEMLPAKYESVPLGVQAPHIMGTNSNLSCAMAALPILIDNIQLRRRIQVDTVSLGTEVHRDGECAG